MPYTDERNPGLSSTESLQLARYVARQPILTPDERVFGYELLFRSGAENHFTSADPSDATRSVIDMSSLLASAFCATTHLPSSTAPAKFC